MNPPQITIDELRQRYPALFSDPAIEDIHCNPGSRGILISLCDTLHLHLDRHPNVPPVAIGQIKSKFGELHFFYECGDEYCAGAVEVAVQLSLKTCEHCGAPGTQTHGIWISTLCPDHNGSRSVQETAH